MAGVAIILHERIGNWSRQLRPRLHDRGARWFETRSSADLKEALAGRGTPISVVDLAGREVEGLDDIELIRKLAPDGLILALNPSAGNEVTDLAHELGATYVFSEPVPPPEVAGLIARWINLAAARCKRQGWSRKEDLNILPEPWNWLAPYLKGIPEFPIS